LPNRNRGTRRPHLGCERCEDRTLLDASLFHLSIADAFPVERPATGTALSSFVVTLDPANIEQTVTVSYQTADGTARAADGNYVPTSGTLTFLPGVVTQTIVVQIPASNLPLPPAQTFFVNLSDPEPGDDVDIADGTAEGVVLNSNPLIVVNTADSGPGSLRDALAFANGIPDPTPGGGPSPDDPVITFAIPGPGPFTIRPTTALPTVSRSLTIDATTQPGFAGYPIVELSGAGLDGPADPIGGGLVVTAGATTIRGLAVNRFPGSGVVLQGFGQNRVVGNFLGTDLGGTVGLGNAVNGVLIDGSPDNIIGGTAPADANLLSGNGSTGVRIQGPDATRNLILGNKIGTDLGGTRSVANADDGVFVNGAPGNTIGGAAAAGNLISGNGSVGVQVAGPSASGNLILGNRIGTDVGGRAALPNVRDGVFINNAPDNSVGGTGAGLGNLIAGNGSVGVQILGPGATGNRLQGNRIGTNLGGDSAVPNFRDGVFINGAPANLIGGGVAGAGNLISGNGSVGVQVLGADSAGTSLTGNLIGVDARGSAPLPNLYGVFLNGAAGVATGAAAIRAQNTVRGNRVAQVFQVVGTPTNGAGAAATPGQRVASARAPARFAPRRFPFRPTR